MDRATGAQFLLDVHTSIEEPRTGTDGEQVTLRPGERIVPNLGDVARFALHPATTLTDPPYGDGPVQHQIGTLFVEHGAARVDLRWTAAATTIPNEVDTESLLTGYARDALELMSSPSTGTTAKPG